MTIERYRNDNPRSSSEIADAIEAELQSIKPSSPVVEGTQNFAFINSVARSLATRQEQALNDLYDAAYITDASGVELTKRARELGVIRQEAVASTGVAKFSRSSPANTDRNIPSGTTISTGGSDGVNFVTTEQATIEGNASRTDTTLYGTTSTSYVTQTSFNLDASYRDSVDVSADIRIDDASASAELQIVDTTNSTTIATFSTSNTSLTSKGPTTYDISSISGSVDIEFQLRTTNSSYAAEVDNSEIKPAGQTASEANIRAEETGPVGNVGALTITSIIASLPGVDNVTNPNPTGDPSYTLTDGVTPQTIGRDREEDDELRERALETTAIGGAGTAAATQLAIENLDDVISADVFTNRSDSTNQNVDPWHTEVRVYGGDVDEIADVLYETLPLGALKTLQGGANGTQDTATLEPGEPYDSITVPITRPTEVSLDVTVDLVHTAEYSGTNAVKNAIIDYVGGEKTDGSVAEGIGQGENIIVNQLENVAEDVTGVEAVTDSIIDDNDDGTDDTTTDSDGVPVYSVTNTEVAVVDATNITVNETQR